MDILVIGLLKNGSKTVGYRLYCVDGKQFKIFEQPENIIVNVLNAGNRGINIKVEKGRLKAVNGAFSRYGEIDVNTKAVLKHALVIYKEARSSSGDVLAYSCVDTLGNVKVFNAKTIAYELNNMNMGVANGKIVTGKDGRLRISSIDGGYPTVIVSPEQEKKFKGDTGEKPKQAVKSVPTPTNNINTEKTKEVREAKEAKEVVVPREREQVTPREQAVTREEIKETPKVVSKPQVKEIETVQKNAVTPEKVVEEPKVVLRDKTEEELAEERYEKVQVIIEEVKKFKDYNRFDYPKCIVATVERYKKCSEKQYSSIVKSYTGFMRRKAELVDSNNPAVKVDTAIELKTDKPVETEEEREAKRQAKLAKEQAERDEYKRKLEEAREKLAQENIARREALAEKDRLARVAREAEELAKKQAKEEELRKQAEAEAEEKKKANIITLADITIKPQPKAHRISVEIPKYTVVTDGGSFEYEKLQDHIYIKAIKDDCDVKDIVIPDTVDINGSTHKIYGIKVGAFKNNRKINSIKTGKYLVDIGQNAFEKCLKLRYLDLSASQHVMIPMAMCMDCISLEAVDLGSRDLERIHEKAFQNCKSLKEVKVGNVETIAREAFDKCIRLESFGGSAKIINDSAFRYCDSLQYFDFSETVSVGTGSFRCVGFKQLVIPSTLKRMGKKAFADCTYLTEVKLEDGVQELGEYCFAKSRSSVNSMRREIGLSRLKEDEYSPIKLIDSPKSIEVIGIDAFHKAELVSVFAGTASEGNCLTHGIPYILKDTLTENNSTEVRRRSVIFSTNPVETLYSFLGEEFTEEERESCGALSNPSEYELNTKKLCNIELSDVNLAFLGVERTTKQLEPHAKFKAALNIIQDLCDLYTAPLSKSVLRLAETYYVNSTALYNDECNRIYRTKFTIMDSLESGECLIFIMDNKLVYCAPVTASTNIVMDETLPYNNGVGYTDNFHVGDNIGSFSSFDGQSGVIKDENGHRVDVGKIVCERVFNNSIGIPVTRKELIVYTPGENSGLRLYDLRANPDFKEKREQDKNFLAYTIAEVLDYKKFIEQASTISNTSLDSTKFFSKLSDLTDEEAKKQVTNINTIETEKESYLFKVSKQFNEILKQKDLTPETASPNELTFELLSGLSNSYWMIPKDEAWYKQVGKKSLNKTNEYHIGNLLLTEYKSNQVVKFSNPYMSGQKGAYIFVLTDASGKLIKGVYASKHSMQIIVFKLSELTFETFDVDPSQFSDLMTDPNNLDRVDDRLFYDFYEVLQSAKDWSLQDRVRGYSRSVYNVNVQFHISMYKPTGVFYLTMKRYVAQKEYSYKTGKSEVKKMHLVTLPIVPIGNMDRALMVAATTNTNNSNSRFCDELVALCISEVCKERNETMPRLRKEKATDPDINIAAYYKVRELIINGCKDVKQYKALVDDRAVYMLGTLHSGVLEVDSPIVKVADTTDRKKRAPLITGANKSNKEVAADLGLDDYEFDVDDLEELEIEVDEPTDTNEEELEYDLSDYEEYDELLEEMEEEYEDDEDDEEDDTVLDFGTEGEQIVVPEGIGDDDVILDFGDDDETIDFG